MAHLDNTLESFSAFLGMAQEAWTVDLTALNSSGASGTAVLAIMTGEDGVQYLKVAVSVTGATPDVAHIQHIHGTFNEDGTPSDAMSPTLLDDVDGDGIVELGEGVPKYGGVLLSLTDEDGNFPVADAEGNISFVGTYNLSEMENSADLMPLMLREIVFHGAEVPDGLGEGTEGEVDGGTNGFIPILPASAGEIEAATISQAQALIEMMASDTVMFGPEDDMAFGGAGNDLLLGGEGNDALAGGTGADSVAGQAGDDIVAGGDGGDVVDGGTGNDKVYAGANDMNIFNAADLGASGALTLAQYDNGLAGGAGDDIVRGGAGDDIITGDDDSRVSDALGMMFDAAADGSDLIFGGAGNDEIHTGSWSDSDQGLPNAQTGMMADTAYGGDGNDILRGAGGNDMLFGDAGNDDVGAGGGNDSAYGGSGDDKIAGNDGMDLLGGGMGMDSLMGDAGADTLYGGAGTDHVMGGAGDDAIYGGADDDFVFGGAGADSFHSSGAAAVGTDVVMDFADTEGDMLVYTGAAMARAEDFVIAQTDLGLGDAGTDDLTVTFAQTGEVMFHIADGAGLDSLMLMAGEMSFDLLG